jgi:hypothetical protein
MYIAWRFSVPFTEAYFVEIVKNMQYYTFFENFFELSLQKVCSAHRRSKVIKSFFLLID